MSEDTKEEVKLEIEDRELEDGKKVRVLKTADGKDLLGVSESFTDEQITEVYNLVNAFFNDGIKVGIARMQGDLQRVLGLVKPEAPAE